MSQYLTDEQFNKCSDIIHSHALTAAGGNLVPIPGVGVAADLGTMTNMCIKLEDYFNETLLNRRGSQRISLGEECCANLAMAALKSTAAKTVVKEFVKFIPIIGQIAGPAMSFGMLETAGWRLANNLCKELLNQVETKSEKLTLQELQKRINER